MTIGYVFDLFATEPSLCANFLVRRARYRSIRTLWGRSSYLDTVSICDHTRIDVIPYRRHSLLDFERWGMNIRSAYITL